MSAIINTLSRLNIHNITALSAVSTMLYNEIGIVDLLTNKTAYSSFNYIFLGLNIASILSTPFSSNETTVFSGTKTINDRSSLTLEINKKQYNITKAYSGDHTITKIWAIIYGLTGLMNSKEDTIAMVGFLNGLPLLLESFFKCICNEKIALEAVDGSHKFIISDLPQKVYEVDISDLSEKGYEVDMGSQSEKVYEIYL